MKHQWTISQLANKYETHYIKMLSAPFCDHVTLGALLVMYRMFVFAVFVDSFETSAERSSKHASVFIKQFCLLCAFGFSLSTFDILILTS